MTDIRVLRSRRKLQDSVLRLAAGQPIESVSVADVTRTAGLNRTTFYNHASSPADALEQALFGDLDAMRRVLTENAADRSVPLDRVWEEITRDFLGWFERYEDIFTTGLLDGRSPVLIRLLSHHFTASIVSLLATRPSLVPDGLARDGLTLAAYSRFVGFGIIGVLQTWLESAPPRDPDALARILFNVLPVWMTHPSDVRHPEREAPTS
ncbi:TetR/AcrR family transcriptional regulator [Streptomyces sp. NPDC060198]|uniref:TetR/AcrR family transcriptional regulator n=1 Tax=Streptomyces sp. NPDC060198 TaxID=3347070 RepID=UPI00364D9BB0